MSASKPCRLRWDRINPCLLDKLSDDDAMFPKGDAVMSLENYRETVERDLRILLATKTHSPTRRLSSGVPAASLQAPACLDSDGKLGDFPEAASSVLTYGVPDFRGLALSELETPDVDFARLLERIIRRFEPRIDPNTLRVEAVNEGCRLAVDGSQAVLHFRITGRLWAYPKPEWLDLKTEINLETGEVEITS